MQKDRECLLITVSSKNLKNLQHGSQVAIITIKDYDAAIVTIIDYDAGQKCKCDHTKFFHYLQSYHVVFANSC
jgi:hypothetical protein